jgi:hypothetical protein
LKVLAQEPVLLLNVSTSSVYTTESCAAPGRVNTIETFAATGRVYTLGSELHLDVPSLQRPVLLLDVSTPPGLKRHLDNGHVCITGAFAAFGGVYTTGA